MTDDDKTEKVSDIMTVKCSVCGWTGRRGSHTYAEIGWPDCPKCGRSGQLLAEDIGVAEPNPTRTKATIDQILNTANVTSTVPEYLRLAATTYIERNLVYKDNYKLVGPIYKALFPTGVSLNSETDFNRFAILTQIIAKLSRYTFNWRSGHSDSLNDLSVYAAMLRELDEEKNNE